MADAFLVILIDLFVDLYALPCLVDDLLQISFLFDYLLKLSFLCTDILHCLFTLLHDWLPLFGKSLLNLVMQFVCFLGLFDESMAIVDVIRNLLNHVNNFFREFVFQFISLSQAFKPLDDPLQLLYKQIFILDLFFKFLNSFSKFVEIWRIALSDWLWLMDQFHFILV